MKYKLLPLAAVTFFLAACDSATISPSNRSSVDNSGTTDITDTVDITDTTDTTDTADLTPIPEIYERIITSDDPIPFGEANVANQVLVKVTVPAGAELKGTAIISLEDTIVSDTDSVVISTVKVSAEELANGAEVPVFLPLPLDANVEIAVTVHIDIEDSGSLSTGDFISTQFAYFSTSAERVATVRLVEVLPI